jgi:hypothetical protein
MLCLRTFGRAVVLTALAVAVAVLSIWVRGDTPRAEAHDGPHPNMLFDMSASSGLGSYCTSWPGSPWDECSAPVSGMFSVQLVMQTMDVSYRYVQFAIEYSGVTSKDDPYWFGPDDCLSTNMDAQAGSLLVGCTVGDMPSAVGEVAFNFNCTDMPSSNNEIKLLVGLGDGESHIRDASSIRHSDQTGVESMFVDCVVPPTADMHLEMKGGDAVCDSTSNPTACTVTPGGTFLVGIATDSPPPPGYTGFQTELLYSGLQYNPPPDDLQTYPFPDEGAEQEVVWPNFTYAAREPFGSITGTEGYVLHYADGGDQDYAGNLVELSMTCAQPGQFPITLTSYNYPDRNDGSQFYAVTSGDNQDNAVRLNSEDTIDITCLAPPTPTPMITPTATPTFTPQPPELGGVAAYPDVGSDGAGLVTTVTAVGALLAFTGGAMVLRRRVSS